MSIRKVISIHSLGTMGMFIKCHGNKPNIWQEMSWKKIIRIHHLWTNCHSQLNSSVSGLKLQSTMLYPPHVSFAHEDTWHIIHDMTFGLLWERLGTKTTRLSSGKDHIFRIKPWRKPCVWPIRSPRPPPNTRDFSLSLHCGIRGALQGVTLETRASDFEVYGHWADVESHIRLLLTKITKVHGIHPLRT